MVDDIYTRETPPNQLVTINAADLQTLRQQAALVPQLRAQIAQLQAQVTHRGNVRRIRLLAQRAGTRSCAHEYANLKHLYLR